MEKLLARFCLVHQITIVGALGIAGLLIVGTIYFWGSALQQQNDAMVANATTAQLIANRIDNGMLEARRAEKDFLLRHDPAYLERHAGVMKEVAAALDELARTVGTQSAYGAAIGQLRAGIADYQRAFTAAGETQRTLGFNENQGLQGKLRQSVHDVEEKLTAYDQPRLEVIMLMMRRHEKDLMARLDAKYLDDMKARARDFAAALPASTIPQADRADIAAKMDAYQTDFATFGERTLAVTAATRKLSDSYAALEPRLDEIQKRIASDYETAVRDGAATSGWIRLLIVAGLVAVVILVAGASWLIGRGISMPLVRMTGRMELLANGAMETEIVGLDRRDEVGAMAKAVQVFKENMIKARDLAAKEAAAIKVREARTARMDSLIADFDAGAKIVVTTVSSASTELQRAATAMNGTADEALGLASAVAAASEEASTNVQTVAAATEELSSSIGEINRQVVESTKIAGQAVAQAERTNGTIQSLAESANRIGDVVKLINDIAGQTNLLALNATIEAARAGEAGKGFAVVAAEVKSLANQTAKATEEISQQIGAIQESTRQSVTAIGDISTTIQSMNHIATTIASAVEEQGAATKEIARNIQEAAKGTEGVSSNIGGVTKAAGETGAAASQVQSSASELAQQAEQLRAQVDSFLAGIRVA